MRQTRPACKLTSIEDSSVNIQQLSLLDILIDIPQNIEYLSPNYSSKWNNFKFIDLFAGIGGIRLGFEHVGGKCVFSSEWDEQAAKTYAANFGEQPRGDITKIRSNDIPEFDILLAGFPCQPFSIIGDKEGFNHETQGTLFFEIERILKDKNPPAFMLENVRNLTAHNGGKTFQTIIAHLEALGYRVFSKVLNALDFGVPQKRERIIICGFLDNVDFMFPNPVSFNKRLSLSDVLEDDNDISRSLWVKDRIKQSRFERMKTVLKRPYITHENVGGSITPHYFSCALRAGASANYILVNNERRLSEREMLRLQGFPDSFKIIAPYGDIKKQTGNSVAVPVIKAVAEQMVKALKKYEWSKNNEYQGSESVARQNHKEIANATVQANSNRRNTLSS
ncbi:MAG: DNA (cytosine-5-)-methyltransferase [Helicobacteraceae bacterium]|jgi:DNA (cytosine-5)-methyltransferase 1|nr:DNA (cytosine-5-)-methyltransferase [Helicobacteraceae bacterium]